MKIELVGYRLAAVLYLGALAWAPAFFLPYDIIASMARFSLSEEQAGWLTSAQLFMLAITAMVVSRWIAGLDKRQTSLMACLVGMAVNLVAFSTDSFTLFVSLKLIYGASAGVLVASGYSLAPTFEHPERVFARVGMTMAVLFGVVMLVVPGVMARLGPVTMDGVHFGLMLIGIVMAPKMPSAVMPSAILEAIRQAKRHPLPKGVKPLLLSVFALFVSQTTTMGFASVAGEHLAISQDDMALGFMISAFAQLPAALLVEWMGSRNGYYRPIIAGVLLLIAIAIGMYCLHDVWLFFVCLTLANAGGMIVNPYLVSLVAQFDESGRSSAIAGSMTNFGMAFGPAVAGLAFVSAGLPAVGVLSIALLLISLSCALSVRRRRVGAHHEMQSI
ncbi:MFS transporter [Pseudomonas monteilii]|uniref:MFS transporter n=1 Tax=Pseudomonas monteilii TaxID=76759 RepID=A0A399MAE8_9PSED|nr:MFS transporter [Pseudomonas monteilii]RII78257.1 MFS transporter [Pseudomonas monteilii]